MKQRWFSLKFWALQLVVLTTASSCISEDDEIRNLMAGKRPSDFDFATSKGVEISVDYGESAAYSFINIYSEDPLANATAENPYPSEDLASYGVALDEKGRFSGTVALPAPTDEIFVYSPSWTAPMLMHANIEKNKASVKFEPQTITKAMTRASNGETYIVRELTSSESSNASNKLYTIVGGWDEYGKIEDVNNLVSKGSLSPAALANIQSKLWNGKTTKPSNLNNSKYVVDNVNMTIKETYVDEEGVTQTTGSAEVWCNFISEAAWNENAFGYYFYNRNNPPTSASQLKKYIILPNASIAAHAPYGVKGNHLFPIEKAPAYTNLQVQLLYVDENGNASKNFPPNTEIGFFTLANAFAAGSSTSKNGEMNYRTAGKIKPTNPTYYSNKAFNDEGKSRYIALNLPDGTIVYGVEDGNGDKSHDDILFSISATPQKAVQTVTELPLENKVEDVNERFSVSESCNTYCFEDMWPSGGDYDLNDVAVRHTRKVTYNQYNYVTEIEDKFDFYNVVGTSYNSTFGIQLLDLHSSFTLPEGATWEEETNSVLFPNKYTNPRRDNVSATIVRKINGVKNDVVKAETDALNPYIIVNNIKGVYDRRVEIHMPNMNATNKGLTPMLIASAVEKGDLPTNYNPWYTSEDGIFPYAITVPSNKATKWKLSPSQVRIDETYPRFKNWAKKKGKEDNDWYKDNNN